MEETSVGRDRLAETWWGRLPSLITAPLSGGLRGLLLASLLVIPWMAMYAVGPAPLILDVVLMELRSAVPPLGLAALLVATICLPVAAIRVQVLHACAVVGGLCAGILLGPRLGFELRLASLSRIASNGEEIITAVEAFHADLDRLPSSLEELVPAYLPRIPQTGVRGYPEFIYHQVSPSDRDQWELVVDCTSSFEADCMVFRPAGVYDEILDGGDPFPIGRWAYIAE